MYIFGQFIYVPDTIAQINQQLIYPTSRHMI